MWHKSPKSGTDFRLCIGPGKPLQHFIQVPNLVFIPGSGIHIEVQRGLDSLHHPAFLGQAQGVPDILNGEGAIRRIMLRWGGL